MRSLMLFTIVLLAACSRTYVLDYQPGTDFSSYQTYAFEASEEVRTLDGARIEVAVRRELTGKLEPADRDQADLLVRYRIEDSVRLQSSGFGYGFGFGRDRLGVGIATVPDAREIKEGKLVIELVERDGRQMVWRAVGQRNLTEQTRPDRREALINRLVSDMFGRFPP